MFLLGEIRMFAFQPPSEIWVRCDGSLLPISEHNALFSLIGFTYGGDGRDFFALPSYFVEGGPDFYIAISGRKPDYTKLAIGLASDTATANANNPR